MGWVDIPLATQVGDESTSGVSFLSDMMLENLEIRKLPPGSRAPVAVIHTPGLASVGTLPDIDSICRGLIWSPTVMGGRYVAVVSGGGTAFYYTSTNLISWANGDEFGVEMGPVRMIDTGTHLVIASYDGTTASAWTIDSSGTLAALSISGFGDVCYQDGFSVYAKLGTQSIYSSDADDPPTVDALHFTTVDALPGNLTAIISDHREVYAFKPKSAEHYFNDGSAGFPFARSNPGIMEVGAASKDRLSVVKHGNRVYFVGDNGSDVYAMAGLRPQLISTPWVSAALRASFAYDRIALVSQHQGQRYYWLLHDQANSFLVYNIDLGLWHKRSAGDLGFAQGPAFRALFTSSDGTETYIVADDTDDGAPYVLKFSPTTYKDGVSVNNTSRVMTLPTFAPGGGALRCSMSELIIDMKPMTAGTVTLEICDDGGSSYGNSQSVDGTVGPIRFTRLGMFRQRNMRLTFAGNSPIEIVGIRANVEVMAS